MDTEDTKGIREIEVFTRFAKAATQPIDLGTIEKRKPPQPDILCTHRDDGPVAFELAEMCDTHLAEFFSTVKDGGAYYMRTADPIAKIIQKKLRRKYHTKYPIELLCYTDGRVGTPVSVILPTIRLQLVSRRGPFRRAWLLSRGVVHHVWPAEDGG